VLHECDLEGEQESDLFVQLAVKLDDGEAVCFAIAKSRGRLLAKEGESTVAPAVATALPDCW
jgi:hypothetical protein